MSEKLIKINGKYPKNTKNLNWEKSTTGKNSLETIKKYAQELESINLETLMRKV